MFVKLNNKGDTIIEVMLSLAVLGALITSAYTIASRSLNGIRISQERSEATKIAEGQLEVIRNGFVNARNQEEFVKMIAGPVVDYKDGYFAPDQELSDSMPEIFPNPYGFCVTEGNGMAKSILHDELEAQDPSNYDAYPECMRNGIYMIYINNSFKSIAPLELQEAGVDLLKTGNMEIFKYNVNVFWQKSGGGGIEQLTMQDDLIYTNF
jgi:type II secretory pathway pseudopilin PulG